MAEVARLSFDTIERPFIAVDFAGDVKKLPLTFDAADLELMGSGESGGAWNGTWYYSPSADNWKYLYNNGNVAIGWNQLSWTFNGVTRNDWYFFNNDGWMSSGLVKLSGNTYYLNPVSDGFKGAMITGEANVNGKQMNFANSGELLN